MTRSSSPSSRTHANSGPRSTVTHASLSRPPPPPRFSSSLRSTSSSWLPTPEEALARALCNGPTNPLVDRLYASTSASSSLSTTTTVLHVGSGVSSSASWDDDSLHEDASSSYAREGTSPLLSSISTDSEPDLVVRQRKKKTVVDALAMKTLASVPSHGEKLGKGSTSASASVSLPPAVKHKTLQEDQIREVAPLLGVRGAISEGLGLVQLRTTSAGSSRSKLPPLDPELTPTPLPSSVPCPKPDTMTLILSGCPKSVPYDRSPFWFIEKIRKNPKTLEFVYLNNVLDNPQTDSFNPYSLQIVPHSERSKDDYYTISAEGITHFFHGEADFTPLSEWVREFELFTAIRNVRFFDIFKVWRSYYLLKMNARARRGRYCRDFLDANLFHLDHELSKSLLEVRRSCVRIAGTRFYRREARTSTMTLDQFHKSNQENVQIQRSLLEQLVESAKKSVKDGCERFMDDAKRSMAPEDETEADERADPSAVPSSSQGDVKQPQITYTDLAARRALCKRLANFIRLADYLVVNALERMIVGSVSNLVSHMTELFSLVDEPEPSEEQDDFSTSKVNPIFVVEILLDNDNLMSIPDSADFQDRLKVLLADYVSSVKSLDRLREDEEFDIFVHPLTSERREESELQGGPELENLIKQNPSFQEARDRIVDVIRANCSRVREYALDFEPFRRMFLENRKLDIGKLKDDGLPLDFFRESLDKYKSQHAEISQIKTRKRLGMFMLDCSRLQQMLLPSPERCLEGIRATLPSLAKQKTGKFYQVLNEALSSIERAPGSIDEFIAFLGHLDSISSKLQDFDDLYNLIREMYELMDERDIPVAPDDLKFWRTNTAHTYNNLHETYSHAEETRDETTGRFLTILDNEIAQVKNDVLNVLERSKDDRVKDPDQDPTDVLEFIQNLQDELFERKHRSEMLRSFQEYLQQPGDRFEEVDDVEAKVAQKNKLWKAVRDWNVSMENWNKSVFRDVVAEEVEVAVQQYYRTANQVTKALPDNLVAPKLLAEVENFRTVVPVLVDLCNPNLRAKPSHIAEANAILGVDIESEELTFGALIETDLPAKAEQVAALSAQASQLAALEEMLRQVASLWDSTSYQLIPHGEIYILSGLDDIIQQLDDSRMTVSTILGSKAVGPIKNRVEQWDANLSFMSKTLDEWILCQKQWLYLEGIFSSQEIQRQLEHETKMFQMANGVFKGIMKNTADSPKALQATIAPGLYDKLREANRILSEVEKKLQLFLDKKRNAFPRFYFLSDDDLLAILADANNPLIVQPYLSKCFDGIKTLQFDSDVVGIEEMISAEGERVSLGKNLSARGPVEKWLLDVEERMIVSLRDLTQVSVEEYTERPFEMWMTEHASQIVLTVAQIFWAQEVTRCLESENPTKALQRFHTQSVEHLKKLAGITRTPIDRLVRNTLGALIIIFVHARDVIEGMLEDQVTRTTDFGWIRQLRYEWDPEERDCFVKQSNSVFRYGYEYLGAQSRLVITPLTDRIYMTLTGALQLKLGGAPAGPAGTGKTETTKDLSKALGRQCVVFNCSEGVTFLMMTKFFSGLVQTGAWACFDEFNRIRLDVLSVIANQVLEIRQALLAGSTSMIFGEKRISVRPTCGIFITMNPGYAGRTELPDNLKSLFRPVACMIPDYRLIAEVILFSEGFENAKILSQKMVQLYKLSSEQLSSQDHYDFGMRAVKSVLVMAGSLKRENPHIHEDHLLIRAMRDSNIPKFLAQDVPLFQAIVSDLFPGVHLPEHDYGELLVSIKSNLGREGFQQVPTFITKILQLYETLNVRHGVMLVGPTGGGKSVCRNILAASLTELRASRSNNENFQLVHIHELNPKSIKYGELYGEYNLLTQEWIDGVVPRIARVCVSDESKDYKWIVFDGPVDTLWIESMNSVLDDSRLLCLDNAERIKLNLTIRLLFEVQDLAVASPATVSRCGMVFIDPNQLGWAPLLQTWLHVVAPKYLPEVLIEYLSGLFDAHVACCLDFVRRECRMDVRIVDQNLVQSLLDLLVALFESQPNLKFTYKEGEEAKNKMSKRLLELAFVFSLVWSIGGNLNTYSMELFDSFAQTQLESLGLTTMGSALYDFYIDFNEARLRKWDEKLTFSPFRYNPETPFFRILVPTVDTVRYAFLLESLLRIEKPVLLNGKTGVGKSVMIVDALNKFSEELSLESFTVQFSAQTSAGRTQEMIELKLDKRRKGVIGPKLGKKMVVFVDDLNMPQKEQFGAQPPIELLRQMIGAGGFYDRETLEWKGVEAVTIVGACGPPGGGRNDVTQRLLRYFSLLSVPDVSEHTMCHIFSGILSGFARDFNSEIREKAEHVVRATVELFVRIREELLPTPTRSHYTFNLRDISKVIQGMLQVSHRIVTSIDGFAKLWIHECTRCFHDRLIDSNDRTVFQEMVLDLCRRHIGPNFSADVLFGDIPLLFCDFLKPSLDQADRKYEEVPDPNRLPQLLNDYLEDYKIASNQPNLKLVFFSAAYEHVCRIARILRQPRGNALLVGVGGSGKRTLTLLASFILDMRTYQIAMKKGYDIRAFRDDLKNVYIRTGVEGQKLVFILNDSQITSESMVEDVNNMLNSGEVPNLFEPEEREKIIVDCRDACRKATGEESREAVYAYFVYRVRENLHMVLCMSPIGDDFRRRLLMFPSLVNCCTIDWFDEWPQDALLSVAHQYLESCEGASPGTEDLIPTNMIPSFAELCMDVHSSVLTMANRYFEEMRRHVYMTPTSYLSFIRLYNELLEKKTKEITNNRRRLENGLSILRGAEEKIAVMEENLQKLLPVLAKKDEEAAVLISRVDSEKQDAALKQEAVAREEAIVNQRTQEAETIKADAEAELAVALPLLAAAQKSLDSLDKGDVAEVKGYSRPPAAVQLVMEAVLTLFGEKKATWEIACKNYLADTQFLPNCKNFDKDNIPESVLSRLQKYIDDPAFEPDAVGGVSVAAKSLCQWVRALDKYAKTSKVVAPKRARLEVAQQEVVKLREELNLKQAELREIEDKLAELQALLDKTIAEQKQLKEEIDRSNQRLKRAAILTESLSGEKVRWIETVGLFTQQLVDLPGDTFVGAACVAYFGPFSGHYRHLLVESWRAKCVAAGITVSEVFDLGSLLSTQVEIREWGICGLPNDSLSIENAVLATRSGKWPLMIDPQGQARKWVEEMEKKNGLKVTKMGADKFLATIEAAIRIGQPVLIEDVGEFIDPALESVLLRSVVKMQGRNVLFFDGKDVEYDRNFRFYMTSKMSNPHYLPETCIKVNLINFTVTPHGLEDQLLADVVLKEEPELEERKNKIILKMAEDKRELKETEDRILDGLSNNSGEILDNQELIEVLRQAKRKSEQIAKKVEESAETEIQINLARNRYRSVAIRGSLLYFVVADLALMDPMYQYSLEYFKMLFLNTIDSSPKPQNQEERLAIYIENITETIYTNVCRGLFEKNKPLFSFLMVVAVLRHSGAISFQEWSIFLRSGSMVNKKGQLPKPDVTWIPESVWDSLDVLDRGVESFSGLCSNISENLSVWGEYSQDHSLHTKDIPIVGGVDWNDRLSEFQRLLLVRALRPEKLFFGVIEFVRREFGETFIKSPPFDLSSVVESTDMATPIIFVLSQGADPTAALMKYAETVSPSLTIVSLGQGQEERARNAVREAKQMGNWVLLQNCHVAASFLGEVELMVSDLIDARKSGSLRVNENFRLWMTSMPSDDFPIPVLQNGVKLTVEPPKGLKANLLRSYASVDPEYFHVFDGGPSFSDVPKSYVFKKLLFGLSFFHAIIQERQKFGPLGWNVKYEFNDSDLSVSRQWLHILLDEQSEIPWESLQYVIGQINYGGRVTDTWDRRCILSILQQYFTPKILDEDATFSQSGIYHPPGESSLEDIRLYIESLPREDAPEVFGMHQNANITNQLQESTRMLDIILDVQPRISSGESGRSEEDIVEEIALAIQSQLPDLLSEEEAHHTVFHVDEKGLMHSLSTVLHHEMSRFNKLLSIISKSLSDLTKALKGLVVLSRDLDRVLRSLLLNRVPEMWSQAAYPSLKPLGSWVKDLVERVSFLRNWLRHDQPPCFWISGLFFPQGFLTGVLQTHARKHVVPIDELRFRFRVLEKNHEDVTEPPQDGVYISGMFLDGARWCRETQLLQDQIAGEMFSKMPVVHFEPTRDPAPTSGVYNAPLYKTSERKGTLSTTGHSTNYVLPVDLPTDRESDYWILKGAALLCQLDV